MLSALTMGLKLMSSQKWSREPQSPVADIGEAGLTGVQTYVGLASADRREKHLEAEMKRKALANKLTGEYREKRLGLEERRVGLQEGEKIQTVSQPFESGGLMYKTITYSSGRTDTKLLTQGENLEPLKGERKGFAPQAQSLVHPKTNERKWFDMNTKEGIEAAQKEGFIPYAKPEEPKAPTLNYEYKNIEGVPHQRQQEWDSKTRQWISKGDWIRREKPPAEKESKSKENKWLGNFGKRYAVTNIYGESLLTKESAIAAWEDFRKQIPTLQKQGYDIDHLTTQMRSLYGEEEAPKPAQEQMPPASQHKGRIIKDTISGKRHKSDGTKWIEVK